MKVTINKNDIVDVLSKIQGLTGRRSSLAITECLMISALDNQVVLKATDLETCFEGLFPAEVVKNGTIAISARKFYEIVREYPQSEIMIEETENRWITLGEKNVQYHLMGMNSDDFPALPIIEDVSFFSVDSSVFKDMIDKSIIISGIGEDKKPHINGVLLERNTDSSPNSLRMVSTDGSRLSIYDYLTGDGKKVIAGPSVLVPKKGLNELSKFLGRSENIEIGIQGSYFIAKENYQSLAIRLLEGQYPPYKDIVFREDGYSIKIKKETFHNMLKRMSILCTDSYRAAMFTFNEDLLIINATNPDIGDSKEDIAISYQGEKIEVAFNPKFFIEALNCIDEENIVVDIISEEKPCLLQGAKEKFYLNAIMPMRV